MLRQCRESLRAEGYSSAAGTAWGNHGADAAESLGPHSPSPLRAGVRGALGDRSAGRGETGDAETRPQSQRPGPRKQQHSFTAQSRSGYPRLPGSRTGSEPPPRLRSHPRALPGALGTPEDLPGVPTGLWGDSRAPLGNQRGDALGAGWRRLFPGDPEVAARRGYPQGQPARSCPWCWTGTGRGGLWTSKGTTEATRASARPDSTSCVKTSLRMGSGLGAVAALAWTGATRCCLAGDPLSCLQGPCD